MCSHLKKQDKQWWEASGLETFGSQDSRRHWFCALFTDGMALLVCIGYGLAALLGSGLGLFARLDRDSFSYVEETYAMGCRRSVECLGDPERLPTVLPATWQHSLLNGTASSMLSSLNGLVL